MSHHDRFPSGRRREPLGVRTGGAAYQRLHERTADAALQLLAERGYADMGMDDVAQLAGALQDWIGDAGDQAVEVLQGAQGFQMQVA